MSPAAPFAHKEITCRKCRVQASRLHHNARLLHVAEMFLMVVKAVSPWFHPENEESPGSRWSPGSTTFATFNFDGRKGSEPVVPSRKRVVTELPLVTRVHYICDV